MEVNGKAIAVDIFDGGAPTLMIHGLGGASNVCYAHREALARSFRVICPDPEGTGRSPLEGEFSIGGFVADMAAMLDPLNISSAHVVGYRPGLWFVSIWHSTTRPWLLGPIAALLQHVRLGLLECAPNVRMNGMGFVVPTL